MRFDVIEDRPGLWSWALLGSYGETIARSPRGYPTQVQASAAATAFAQLVARASAQMRGQ